ncbi:MAG: UPF0149 family protein [Gammaproteobacteria bacterium]|nr:UPF0149 family protein [Gammaproteobacteria bacterium]
MTTELTADFSTVRGLLHALDASWEPAEAHGAFCGRACLSGSAALRDWVTDLAGDRDPADVLAGEDVQDLQRLAATSLLQLEGRQMNFRLLLPDENAPIDERTSSLADWCHGFMHGLSSAGGADQGPYADALESGVVKEIIDDFSEITRAAADQDASEAAEFAFAELEEYVRVSVQLIYEETAELRGGSGAAGADQGAAH